jgi:two-component system, response regulator PdtaR
LDTLQHSAHVASSAFPAGTLEAQGSVQVNNPLVALVVEDEALLRFNLPQSLEAAGYTTYEAANAAEAIQVMETQPDIRVVFTDIQMPGTMDGLELSRYVRGRWPPTIIVVTSGRCAPAQNDMASGALFLAKPYPPGVLGEVLAGIRERLCE